MGGGAPDLTNATPLSLVDILLAILAWAIYILELITWLLTLPIVILTSLATYPLRELLYQLLVVPAWDLYMKCRLPLVMEGFLSPKPSEVSMGLVTLGLDEKGAMAQLRADLASPSGFATDVEINESMPEPSGLDATRGADTGGYGLDPAYPRAMVTDLNPPWFNKAPIDSPLVYSEFVAPWRYPDHNLAGMRNGWEAPRTHVGPYQRPDDANILMGGMPGSDVARRWFENARTPEETEAVSSELLPQEGAHLGDPLDYGAYLIGQLTGSWSNVGGTERYVAHDDAHPLPDFNLDADRGYAYQCWDYVRHTPSTPPSPPDPADPVKPTRAEISPDQWLCMPQIPSILSQLTGTPPLTIATNIRDWYGYPEPCTVPQRYDPADNPHHRSRYDPLKRLAHYYRPRADEPATTPPGTGCTDVDLQVSEAEMRAVGMSPTGRRVPR